MSAGVPLSWYLILSAILFALGVAGFLLRRNVITVFMSIELMLNAVNLSFITFSYQLKQVNGHIFSFFVMVVAAAEAAVGLAIILTVFKNRSTLNIDDISSMKNYTMQSLAHSRLSASRVPDQRDLRAALSKAAGQHHRHRLGAALLRLGAEDSARPGRSESRAHSSTTSPGSKAAR